MNEIRILSSLEFKAVFGINKLRHTKDKKVKNRYKLLGLVWLFVILMVISYTSGLVFSLCTLELDAVVPSYLVFISSLLVFIFGLFKAGSELFSVNGYDMLSSMPVNHSSVAVSRFAVMYFEELIFTLAVMIPGALTYGILQKSGVAFYVIFVIGTLFIPAVPLVISSVVGTVITAISSRMKNKSIVQIILTVIFIVGILLASFGIQEDTFSLEMIYRLADAVSELIGKIYPIAFWLGEAMTDSNVASLILFIVVSAVSVAACVTLTAMCYDSIMSKLSNVHAKHEYKISRLDSRSMLKALYVREIKLYFSSVVYVTNTIIGPILGCVMSGAVCFVGTDELIGLLPFDIPVNSIIPLAVSVIFCMMTATSSAISMEGKQISTVKTLPIPAKTFLDSKILLNLTLILPFYVISQVFLIIALKPTLSELVWMIIAPMLVIIVSVVFGITVNLKFHSFDWEKEEQVVKQSLNAMLGGFAGMILSVLLIAVIILSPIRYLAAVKVIICVLLFAVVFILYIKNNSIELQKL